MDERCHLCGVPLTQAEVAAYRGYRCENCYAVSQAMLGRYTPLVELMPQAEEVASDGEEEQLMFDFVEEVA